jgi:hypothetical protein
MKMMLLPSLTQRDIILYFRMCTTKYGAWLDEGLGSAWVVVRAKD